MASVFRIIGFVTVLCISAVIGGLAVIVNNSNQISETKMQSEDNARVLAIIVAYTGCTTEDSMESCQSKLRVVSTTEGARRIAEVDCVTRRALAKLPAPIPPGTCTSQTPPDVYPGGTP